MSDDTKFGLFFVAMIGWIGLCVAMPTLYGIETDNQYKLTMRRIELGDPRRLICPTPERP